MKTLATIQTTTQTEAGNAIQRAAREAMNVLLAKPLQGRRMLSTAVVAALWVAVALMVVLPAIVSAS